MIAFQLPTFAQTQLFLQKQAALPFTYAPLQATRQTTTIPNYDNDQLKVIIGKGDADFNLAKQAIQNWQMFPARWTRILPQGAPIEEGITVAMYARFLGVWWRNACRIVYIIDEPNRFGFAYGTLPGHVESGEELFLVFKDESNQVGYEIKAFSKPRYWLAKLGYPIMRLLQARFRRDSAEQMRDFVTKRFSDWVTQ